MADVDLTKIEGALNDIKSNVSNIQNDVETSKPNFDAGMQKLVSKIDALDTLRAWATTSTGRTSSGRFPTGVSAKISEIAAFQKNISTNTDNIATSAGEINSKIADAVQILRHIEGHITGSSSTTATPSAATGVTATTTDIHSTVKDILTEIKGIRLDLASKIFNTGNDEIDDKLKEIAELEADAKLYRAKMNEYYRTGKVDGKELKGRERRQFEREERRRQKEEQKRRDRTSGKRGGGATAVKAMDFVKGLITEKPSASKLADKGISAVSQASPVVGGILSLIKAVIELGSKQDRATSEFARAIGGGRFGKVSAGESVRNMVRGMPATMGYTADAAYSAMTEVAEARGRTTDRMSSGALKSAIDLKRFGIGADAINNFDTFGKSLEETDRYFAKLYGEVSKKGLSFKNVSKAVNDNLKAAQSHTFANGLRGLQRMAETSTQLKYNMQQVFQLADKVSEVEGAISTSANLSVLGGQFAQFSNPMQLLYEGLNDTGALNERLIKMFGNRASWNKETQQMDMTALDREFVKQAAKAAGLDPNEMISMSLNEGKMRHIGRQIHGVDKDTAEYIKNIAEIGKNGQAYVTLNGKEKAVSELSMADKESLEKESRAKDARENAKLGDIYSETMSIGETLDNLLSYLQEQLGRWVFGLFNRFAAKENNRMTTAQGQGSKELQSKRAQYYNEHASEHRRTNWEFWRWGQEGGTRNTFAENVAKMSEAEINRRLDEDRKKREGTPQSPGGLNPQFRIPGGSGIISGPSHFEGGVKGRNRGQAWEAEGGEYLINKNSSLKYKYELAKIQNGTFNPYAYANDLIKNDMSKHYGAMEVANKGAVSNQMLTQNQPNQVSGTIKVDIPQTITINIAGQGKVGDYDISGIIRNYVDAFMKEAEMRKSFSGFNKEKFYNQAGVVSAFGR